MSWGGIHASQHVAQNNQIACDIVDSHGGPGGRYSNRNRSSFQITSYFSRFIRYPVKKAKALALAGAVFVEGRQETVDVFPQQVVGSRKP